MDRGQLIDILLHVPNSKLVTLLQQLETPQPAMGRQWVSAAIASAIIVNEKVPADRLIQALKSLKLHFTASKVQAMVNPEPTTPVPEPILTPIILPTQDFVPIPALAPVPIPPLTPVPIPIPALTPVPIPIPPLAPVPIPPLTPVPIPPLVDDPIPIPPLVDDPIPNPPLVDDPIPNPPLVDDPIPNPPLVDVFEVADQPFVASVLGLAPQSRLERLINRLHLNPYRKGPGEIAIQLVLQQIPKSTIYQALTDSKLSLHVEFLQRVQPIPNSPYSRTADRFGNGDLARLNFILYKMHLAQLSTLVDHLLIHPSRMSPGDVAIAIIDKALPKLDIVNTLDLLHYNDISEEMVRTFHITRPLPLTPLGQTPLIRASPTRTPFGQPTAIPTVRIPADPTPTYI